MASDITIDDIKWSNPPPNGAGAQLGGGMLQQFADLLKERPGEWAQFPPQGAKPDTNKRRAERFKKMGCEAVTRTVDGYPHVWARWPEGETTDAG